MSTREFYDPALEKELYETWRVRDCEHHPCHTPMGDGVCLRRHIFVLQGEIERLKGDLQHFKARVHALEKKG